MAVNTPFSEGPQTPKASHPGAHLAPWGRARSCPGDLLECQPPWDKAVELGSPWWTAGGSGRSLVAPSYGGSAGATSWALPARPWAAPGRPGGGQHQTPSPAVPGSPVPTGSWRCTHCGLRLPGSGSHPCAWTSSLSQGLEALSPEAQGSRKPGSHLLRGRRPQGQRLGTHQMEILLCVQVFHYEKKNTHNKQTIERRGERERKQKWRQREMERSRETHGEERENESPERHRRKAERGV